MYLPSEDELKQEIEKDMVELELNKKEMKNIC